MDLKVTSSNPGIMLEEFDGRDVGRQLIDINNSLYQPGVDPLLRDAFLPTALYLYKPRYFRVHGRAKVKAVITAEPVPVAGRHAALIGAKLEVLCLDRMAIKVAICNVKARDAQGDLKYHAKPCDPMTEVDNMNAIWTPQANIAFELVSSAEVEIDHEYPETQAQLTKAFGFKEPGHARFIAGGVVSAAKLRELFATKRVKGAHMTFFLVHQVLGKGEGQATGTMNSELGMAFIAGTHFPTTFAHEAGHYLGRDLENGQWAGHEHLAESETRMLMKDGGSSWAIPFSMVKRARKFSGKPL